MSATIKVQRKPGGWTDRARKYGVYVDGSERGKLKHGESIDVQVEPGSHTVKMKVDWCRSREIAFNAAEGQTYTFQAEPRFVLVAILAAFFYFWGYIKLEQL